MTTPLKKYFAVLENILYCAVSLPQLHLSHSSAPTGRCVTLIMFLALTILYAAYSANIVVLLRAPSSSVRSLPDLLNSPLKLGASDFEYNRYFFKVWNIWRILKHLHEIRYFFFNLWICLFFQKLNDPIRKSIYEKKIAPKGKKPNFYSMKDGVDRIRKVITEASASLLYYGLAAARDFVRVAMTISFVFL